jgi:hypothetical protein
MNCEVERVTGIANPIASADSSTARVDWSTLEGIMTTFSAEHIWHVFHWRIRGAVALALLLTAVVLAACAGEDAESDPGAVVDEDAVAEAQAVVDAHFAAYNAGDPEAAIALFATGATFSKSFYGEYPRESIEQDIVWAGAQGTTYVRPSCAAAEAGDGAADQTDDARVTIVCETENLDAPSLAVGGPAVPVIMTIVVSADGIERIESRYGSPNFRHVTDPFEAWVGEHHPQDAAIVGHFNWDSTAGARQNGLLTAEYATEWADYLEANDCTYREDC